MNDQYRFAEIILPLNLTQTLTYGIPVDMQGRLERGMRVEVSLGRNKTYSGIIESLHNDKPDSFEIRPVRAVIDDTPIVNEQQLQFWKWIAHYYMASPGEIMQAALPSHLKLAAETRLEWTGRKDIDDIIWSNEGFMAVEKLQVKSVLTISELKAITGPKHLAAVINELIENGTVFINEALEPAYMPRKEKVIEISAIYSDPLTMQVLFKSLEKAPKQLELLMAFLELSIKNDFVKQSELIARTGAATAAIKTMADKDIFIISEQDVERLSYTSSSVEQEIKFTPAQQSAYDALSNSLIEKDVVLLQGVTGSGKTLLYIKRIRESLAAGKQAILLLPEIALTTQLVSRLHSYFGEEMGVYHSRFSNNERVEIWEKVKKGHYKLIVGTRSALWLPYSKLDVIIVDEEHDPSFKQKDPAPRFHARDAAIYLAKLASAKVIVGSATPSVETLYNVQQKKYAHVELNERYQGVNMPAIRLVNARSLEQVRSQNIRLITPELRESMCKALQQRKQVILFQNRRGYSPFQICTTCGWVPHCKNCAVSLTYHKTTDKLHCHYCGFRTGILYNCMQCGSASIVSKTFGTEKIEEEVHQLFPDARVARMDLDSTRGKKKFSQLLDKLQRHQIDILIGTQMVVKGLDLANVALVAVLSADSLLNYPDFRVNERAYQLMKQVSGRAGRGDGDGEVLIQAYNLQHPVLQWVQEHDNLSFYKHEIEFREMFGYPPFSRLIKIIFKHKEEPVAIAAGNEMAMQLQTLETVSVQGPVAATISRIQDLYIREIWIKCPRDTTVLDKVKVMIRKQRQQILATKGFSSVQIIIDIDPA